jgi:hypothetical protein
MKLALAQKVAVVEENEGVVEENEGMAVVSSHRHTIDII